MKIIAILLKSMLGEKLQCILYIKVRPFIFIVWWQNQKTLNKALKFSYIWNIVLCQVFKKPEDTSIYKFIIKWTFSSTSKT
jgi:hypothetical protein